MCIRCAASTELRRAWAGGRAPSNLGDLVDFVNVVVDAVLVVLAERCNEHGTAEFGQHANLAVPHDVKKAVEGFNATARVQHVGWGRFGVPVQRESHLASTLWSRRLVNKARIDDVLLVLSGVHVALLEALVNPSSDAEVDATAPTLLGRRCHVEAQMGCTIDASQK